MGPEDHFFCGYKWDDPGCQSRQHCPSGRSEECEGSMDGVKCFANTNCDTRYGDGDYFVPGQPPKQSPAGGSNRPTYSGMSENATDYYWCGVSLEDAADMCDTHCPSGASSECPHGKICFFNVWVQHYYSNYWWKFVCNTMVGQQYHSTSENLTSHLSSFFECGMNCVQNCVRCKKFISSNRRSQVFTRTCNSRRINHTDRNANRSTRSASISQWGSDR